MSINNSILKLLNNQDENITFDEFCVKEENIKGIRCLVINGYLDCNPSYCFKCGAIKDEKIIKSSCKIVNIKIPKISELNSYLSLKKQMYKCKHCNKKFISMTSVVDYRCRISNNTKHSIINYSKEIMSHKLISKIHNVSNMTVLRINNKVFDKEKIYKHYLPQNICMDEFTYKKGIMAFNFCDASNGRTIDIIENRSLDNLNKYFSYYMPKAKDKVKNVVIDMYKPYITLIKDNFKNANIIIDMFHIVQLISRRLNKTRIKVMKQDKTNYRKIKRYWRLLLKSRLEIDRSSWKKYLCFKNLMTEVDIVDYILEKNSELKESYELYQNILYSLQHRDYKLFNQIISKEYIGISDYMKTTINTLKEFTTYIKNTLEQPYSNGIMERNNNTCKLIKRIAFGFRNFKNFKARIMIMTNLFKNKKEVDFTSTLLNV